jgi:hypothetical protein
VPLSWSLAPRLLPGRFWILAPANAAVCASLLPSVGLWARRAPCQPAGASSSAGQSARLISVRSEVQILPGPPLLAHHAWNGGVAQLGERLLCKQEVIGSNPFTSTTGNAGLCRPAVPWGCGDVRRRSRDTAAGDRGGGLIEG